jgi:hypothetical protein
MGANVQERGFCRKQRLLKVIHANRPVIHNAMAYENALKPLKTGPGNDEAIRALVVL